VAFKKRRRSKRIDALEAPRPRAEVSTVTRERQIVLERIGRRQVTFGMHTWIRRALADQQRFADVEVRGGPAEDTLIAILVPHVGIRMNLDNVEAVARISPLAREAHLPAANRHERG
jgi:hypothetical protein